MEWPWYLYVAASITRGPFPDLQYSAAQRVASRTANTSIPSICKNKTVYQVHAVCYKLYNDKEGSLDLDPTCI